MSIEHRILDRWPDLFTIRDPWSELLARSSSDVPTLSPLWLETWWRVFGRLDGRRLRVMLLYDGRTLIGIAPLLARTVRLGGVVPVRRLELLGSGEDEADEICSDYIGLIADRGRERDVAHAFVAALSRGDLGPWDELVLDMLRGDAPMSEAVVRALAGARVSLRTAHRAPAPYIPLPGSWADYLARLSSSRRYTVKRSVRELDRWAGGQVEVRRAETPDQLAEGMAILERLHAERWSEAGSAGVFASPRFAAFHREVTASLLDRDALDLMWVCARGEPVAAVYNIVWSGEVYFYQSGRRMDVPGKVRPGIAMHAYAIQRAIERGCTRYDFLSGASRYKSQLALAETPLLTVRASRRGSPAAMVQRATEAGRDAARRTRTWWRRRTGTAGEEPSALPGPADG